ncbi:putative ribonuclease H-like domain-containing protein, partial [Tanacetum coccineum]
AAKASSTNTVNTTSTPVSTASPFGGLSFTDLTNTDQDDFEIPALEDSYDNPNDGIFTNASYDDVGAVADFTNLETIVIVSPIPTSRIHSIHPSTLILRDLKLAVQTRSKVTQISGAHAFVYKNKKDERGVVVRNKARLVAQGHMQEEGIDYNESIRDVKSAFMYGKIDEEVYVSEPLGFVDPNGYKRGTIDMTLFIKKDKNDIMLVQVYVDDIIFGSTKRSWCDEFEALMKSRFQMSSLRELTFFLGLQVKQKEDGNSKAKPKLGLWYPRVSFFDLEAYSDSDYDGANLDKKSITGEAEYVATTNCFRQVLWIQNQMLDYGFNFMNTKIYIDNESTICIVKNLIFHSKTKYIAIRHHFIRDAYEKKLIQVLRIQTNGNVADLLTKAFNVSRESLERDIDGTEELLLPDLFILWLTIVSTDNAKLIPSCPNSTTIEYLEKTNGNTEFH